MYMHIYIYIYIFTHIYIYTYILPMATHINLYSHLLARNLRETCETKSESHERCLGYFKATATATKTEVYSLSDTVCAPPGAFGFYFSFHPAYPPRLDRSHLFCCCFKKYVKYMI